MSQIITVTFAQGQYEAVADQPLTQWAYGQKLKFVGLELPAAYAVDFSNWEFQGDSIQRIGNADGVAVPTEVLTSGRNVYAFIWITDANSGRRRYMAMVRVVPGPGPDPEEPNPQESSEISEVLAELNAAVETAEDAASRGPQIRDGYWYTWNAESQEYENTEVPSTGNRIWWTTAYISTIPGSRYTVPLPYLNGPAGASPAVSDLVVGPAHDTSGSATYLYYIFYVDTANQQAILKRIGSIKGDKGDTGETPDLSIGTVTTGAAGSSASASITGTPEEPVLNLTIPKGDTGATPDLSIGTVTTGAAGSSASASITGTPEEPVLNLTIPKGDKGDKGTTGATGPEGPGVSDDLRAALVQLAAKVAYIDDGGQTYYNDLYNALYNPPNVAYITAVFNQGTTKVYDDTPLDDLKPMLTVFGFYDNNTSQVLTNYTLTGTLATGTSTVTVTALGKTTTFDVLVTGLSSISAVYTQSGTVYDTDTLDSLKADLVVTAHYSDSSTSTVAAADYTLSGTLTIGTSTITAAYSGKTTTFDVIVTESIPLPSGYTRFDYIACDGNAYCEPFANTSNPPVPLGYSVRTIAQQTTHSESGSGVACGGSNTDYYIGFAVYSPTAGRAGAYYGATYNTYADIQNLLTAPTDFTTKFTTSGVTTTTINSGVSNTVNVPVASVVPSAATTFRIGHSGTTTTRFIGKIYLIEVRNTSDTLTHQFIPCKRDSDSKAGMYDTVSNTFFVSTGSSAFTAGND